MSQTVETPPVEEGREVWQGEAAPRNDPCSRACSGRAVSSCTRRASRSASPTRYARSGVRCPGGRCRRSRVTEVLSSGT
jgi:hypothetical protein